MIGLCCFENGRRVDEMSKVKQASSHQLTSWWMTQLTWCGPPTTSSFANNSITSNTSNNRNNSNNNSTSSNDNRSKHSAKGQQGRTRAIRLSSSRPTKQDMKKPPLVSQNQRHSNNSNRTIFTWTWNADLVLGPSRWRLHSNRPLNLSRWEAAEQFHSRLVLEDADIKQPCGSYSNTSKYQNTNTAATIYFKFHKWSG